VAGIISIVIYTGTAVLLLKPIGLYSLMVADAVKHFSHTMIMLWLLQRHLGGLRGFGISSATWKALVASVATGLVAYAVGETAVALLPLSGFSGKLVIVTLAGGLGLLTFLGLVQLLTITEVQMLHRTLVSKLRRRKQKT
jgi:putative peptidoglycan lipid II flippase